jgi:hypothetical protein
MRTEHEILVGQREGKRPLEDGFSDIVYESVDCIHQARVRDKWWTVMFTSVFHKMENVLISWATVVFIWRIPFHWVSYNIIYKFHWENMPNYLTYWRESRCIFLHLRELLKLLNYPYMNRNVWCSWTKYVVHSVEMVNCRGYVALTEVQGWPGTVNSDTKIILITKLYSTSNYHTIKYYKLRIDASYQLAQLFSSI